MAASLALVLDAGLDPVAGGIIVALVGAAGVVGGQWAGKTRPSAAVERADIRQRDAEAWSKMLERAEALLKDSEQANEVLRGDIQTLRERVDEAENDLAEERRTREALEERIDELEKMLAQP